MQPRSKKPAKAKLVEAPGAIGNAPLLACLIPAVAVIVLATHWPALSAKAISFDDNQYLTENPLVQNPSWSSTGRFLTEILEPSTVRGYYQPLAMISLMLDAAMRDGLDDLRPFHRTSLALHTANTALVVVLLYLLFGQPWVAAMVGLLYGVHPLTVEPIPWVGERKTVLTTFFALWSLVLYVRYAKRGGSAAYVGAACAYVLALMSKPTSTPLPVLMLLLDVWPLGRISRRALVEKVPLLAIAGISAVITYVSQARTASVAGPTAYSAMVIPLTLCHNVVFYLGKIVLPVNLSPHYPYPQPFDLSQPGVIVGIVGTVVLIAALLVSLKWTRAVVVSWLFFFVAIFPTMGVVGFTHSIASDKYAYLPSIGLLLLVAWILGELWRRTSCDQGLALGRVLLCAAVFVVAGASIVKARRQHAIWRDTEAHFRYMLTLSPDSRILHFGLGDALRTRALSPSTSLSRQERVALLDEAGKHYRATLRPGPDSPFGRNDRLTCSAHNNLGNLLAQQGNAAEAVGHWREVLRLDPMNVNAHNNLGIALAWQGKTDEAIAHYRKALDLRDDLPETLTNLGVELARKGRLDEAIACHVRALRLRPGFDLAIRNLAAALKAKGKTDAEIAAVVGSLGH
ncbi:MAG: tetratricopeptide repeat protein [Phycisphaerae bacterium]|nr:tetratricopeptide repeat protein [Phycisphaerae bacterium]